jgi:hypothetical protein
MTRRRDAKKLMDARKTRRMSPKQDIRSIHLVHVGIRATSALQESNKGID